MIFLDSIKVESRNPSPYWHSCCANGQNVPFISFIFQTFEWGKQKCCTQPKWDSGLWRPLQDLWSCSFCLGTVVLARLDLLSLQGDVLETSRTEAAEMPRWQDVTRHLILCNRNVRLGPFLEGFRVYPVTESWAESQCVVTMGFQSPTCSRAQDSIEEHRRRRPQPPTTTTFPPSSLESQIEPWTINPSSPNCLEVIFLGPPKSKVQSQTRKQKSNFGMDFGFRTLDFWFAERIWMLPKKLCACRPGSVDFNLHWWDMGFHTVIQSHIVFFKRK